MSAAGILDRLLGRVKSNQAERLSTGWTGYRQLLSQAATDESAVDCDELEIVLGQVERTPQQFADDVALYKRRLKWAKALSEGPRAEAESRRLHAEIERRGRELNEYVERERAAIRELVQVRQSHDAAVVSASTARSELERTCADPGLLSQLESAQARQRELAAQERTILDQLGDTSRGGLLSELGYVEGQLSHWSSMKDAGTTQSREYIQGEVESLTRRVQAMRDRRSQLESTLAGIRSDMRACQAECDQVRGATLVP